MKIIRRHLLGGIVILVAAALVAFAAMLEADRQRAMLLGMSSGLGVVAVARIVQMLYYLSNPEKGKRYAQLQAEERALFIANKSAMLTLSLSVSGIFVAAGVLMLLENDQAAMTLMLTGGAMLLLYRFIWFILNRKY